MELHRRRGRRSFQNGVGFDMSNVQTKLGAHYKNEWIEENPEHFIVNSRPMKTMAELHDTVSWVKENTVGNSTAAFDLNADTISGTVILSWYFSNEEDAMYFKMVWC